MASKNAITYPPIDIRLSAVYIFNEVILACSHVISHVGDGEPIMLNVLYIKPIHARMDKINAIVDVASFVLSLMVVPHL